MKRLLAIGLASLVGFGAAQAAPGISHAQSPTTPYRLGKILGIVPPINKSLPIATGQAGTDSIYYNGGPVMTTNKVYTIFWAPPGYNFDPTYQSQINGFFKDLQADNGKNSNGYDAATQYSEQTGGKTQYIQYNTTFGGTYVDNSPLPPLDPVNCYDFAVAATNGVSTSSPQAPSANNGCVTDSQIQAEVSNAIKANNWPVDNNTEFFMYTAPNIGTCIPDTMSEGAGNVGTTVSPPLCSFSGFCAYHSWYFDSTVNPNTQIIYANMPYAYQTAGNPVTCDDGFYPNGNGKPDAADPEINVMSHEHNEAITDPFGTGWWDSNPNDTDYGMENGDMCAYVWGNLYGPTPQSNPVPGQTESMQWNQTVNGHHYIAQQEWSNADHGCVSSENPQLTLTPNIGYPSAPFKVGGLFFNAGETATFSFLTAGSQTPEVLGTKTADASGHVAPFLTSVPTDAGAGQATIVGSGGTSGTSGTAEFTVPN